MTSGNKGIILNYMNEHNFRKSGEVLKVTKGKSPWDFLKSERTDLGQAVPHLNEEIQVRVPG